MNDGTTTDQAYLWLGEDDAYFARDLEHLAELYIAMNGDPWADITGEPAGDFEDAWARADVDDSDAQILTWATEAARGGMPGLPPDPNADLTDYVVDRFPAGDGIQYNRVVVRPKTPFGV